VAGRFGDRGHLGEQGALLGGRGGGAGGEEVDLGGLLALELVFGELGAVVVGTWSFGQELGRGVGVGGVGRFAVDRAAVDGDSLV
jgi:hypothetical protein